MSYKENVKKIETGIKELKLAANMKDLERSLKTMYPLLVTLGVTVDFKGVRKGKYLWLKTLWVDNFLTNIMEENEYIKEQIHSLTPICRNGPIKDNILSETTSRVFKGGMDEQSWLFLLDFRLTIGYDISYSDGYVTGVKLFGGGFKMRFGKYLRKVKEIAERDGVITKGSVSEDMLHKIALTHGEYSTDMTNKLEFHTDAESICNRYKELDNITTCIMDEYKPNSKFFEVHELMNLELVSFKGEMGIQARVMTYHIPGCNKAYGNVYVSNDSQTNNLSDTFTEELERLGYVHIYSIANEYRRIEIDIPKDRKFINGGYLDNLYEMHIDEERGKLIFTDQIILDDNSLRYMDGFTRTWNHIRLSPRD